MARRGRIGALASPNTASGGSAPAEALVQHSLVDVHDHRINPLLIRRGHELEVKSRKYESGPLAQHHREEIHNPGLPSTTAHIYKHGV
jgi:hypothetical protein